MPNLELFVMAGCPYCIRVLDYMRAAGIEMPVHDIYADPQAFARLMEVGGKKQTPCLFIDGVAMYESADIIDYLRKHVG